MRWIFSVDMRRCEYSRVGCGVAVADAHPLLRQVADMILKSNGGYGAVREICDLIVAKVAESI